ncbi:MAG: chemotaxis protein CheX [Kofleriaceae bacterium]
MPTSKITLAQWRTAVEGAAGEIASYALSFSGAVVQDPVGVECTVALIGAHLPLIGDGHAYDLALVTTPAACRALARAILCIAPDAPVRDAEVADAIGEIANMLGGGVKRRLAGASAVDLLLGLPIFLHGYIEPTERMVMICLPTRLGTIETMVLIAGHRS